MKRVISVLVMLSLFAISSQAFAAKRPQDKDQKTTITAPALETHHVTQQDARFPMPPQIASAVDFWTRVFSEWHSWETVLHNRNNMDQVYLVLDMEELQLHPGDSMRVKILKNKQRKKTLKAAKMMLVKQGIAKKAKDIREQRGMRERLENGLAQAGQYIPHMVETFRAEGLPEELVALCFVESMFNFKALSKVGAGGPWQIMRRVAKKNLKMRVNRSVDERRDPFLATQGAARLLEQNHGILKSWPLAITAYNHGVSGVRRATRRHDTKDIGVIVEKYKSRRFGFASRNFYAEFLAVKNILTQKDSLFPGVYREYPLQFVSKRLKKPTMFNRLALKHDTQPHHLAKLNPALSRKVLKNKKPIPRGTTVYLPGPETR